MDIVTFSSGAIAEYEQKNWRIITAVSTNEVHIKCLTDKVFKIVDVKQLKPAKLSMSDAKEVELSVIDNDKWDIALFRYHTVKPYIDIGGNNAKKLAIICHQAGIDLATAYRWIEAFKKSGKISSLLPRNRGRKAGKTLLSEAVENIINDTIDKHYLTKQKKCVSSVVDRAVRQIKRSKLPIPHKNTIRKRIADISERKTTKAREGEQAARHKHDPILDHYTHAKWPLSIVQIDHTPIDLMVVCSEDRSIVIGKPWMTVAIDVYSRVVLGVYISLDPPSALSVGLCLYNAMLPKENWLEQRGIKGHWPCYGIMDVVHADNAKEFRGKMLQRACKEYTTDLHWRPVGRSHFGGHIERLLGNFNGKLHELPGTTFSNFTKKGDYNSEAAAVMTFDECERYLMINIIGVYHRERHSGINCPPLVKYEEGILGTDTTLARGLPSVPVDERKLMLDMLPIIERSIQRYGVLLDFIEYMSDVLVPWINTTDPATGKARKFIFKRDPRDISVLYFWDPELKRYFDIPYRNLDNPSLTLWELRAIRRHLDEQGLSHVNEDDIFSAYDELDEIEETAIKETKRHKRAKASKKAHKNTPIPHTIADEIYNDNSNEIQSLEMDERFNEDENDRFDIDFED